VFGVGPDNFKEHYQDFKYRYMPGRALEPRALHNMYLSVPVEAGLLGFACFGALLFVAMRDLGRARIRAPDPEARALAEALHFAFGVYLMICVFGSSESSKYLWIFAGLSVALAEVAQRESPTHRLPDGG
jgi:O-antigen ligase